MPQIHYGILTRDIAVTIDWCWDGWNEQQKDNAINIIAEKGVESYWRIVNHTPFMGLHHLRSKNQGNNALSAALIASLVVGDSVPENKVWIRYSHSFIFMACNMRHWLGWSGAWNQACQDIGLYQCRTYILSLLHFTILVA